jgi:hypothetical protein
MVAAGNPQSLVKNDPGWQPSARRDRMTRRACRQIPTGDATLTAALLDRLTTATSWNLTGKASGSRIASKGGGPEENPKIAQWLPLRPLRGPSPRGRSSIRNVIKLGPQAPSLIKDIRILLMSYLGTWVGQYSIIAPVHFSLVIRRGWCRRGESNPHEV